MATQSGYPARKYIEETAMAGGWARDGAVQEQIDSTIEDAVKRARARLPQGPGRQDCEECGEAIPQARRDAIPGVRLCIACQEAFDKQGQKAAGPNRRGSKDSQLR